MALKITMHDDKDSGISSLIDKISDSCIDSVLKETFSFLLKKNSLQSSTIKKLQNEVCSLRTKIIDLERYQSKDSVTIYNLARESNRVMKDVLRLFNNRLKVSVSPCDSKACHPLSKMQDPRSPSAVIVKFLYFNQKNVFLQGKKLKGEINPLNNQPKFL